jgi:hypothetical protein
MDCLSSRSNGNASYISSTFCTCSVSLRSPPLLVLDDVALPIIDEIANEFFRLFKQVNNEWKMAVLLVRSCREMKCFLQNSASICEYLKDMKLHAISVYVISICEVKPVYCESDLVTWTLPFVSFNPATKKWP